MRMVGYARVSTKDQNTDLQIDALRKFGVKKKYIFEEKISGIVSAEKRPVFNNILKKMKKGDTLVVYRLDRLGRNTREILNLIHDLGIRGLNLIILKENINTEGPIGKMIVTLLAAIADLERDIIKERCSAGLKAYKDRGGTLGRPRILKDSPKIIGIKKMRNNGLSFREISIIMGMSKTSVFRYLKIAEDIEKVA